MKKTTISIFIMLFAFSMLLTTETKATPLVETAESCSLSQDGDGDTLTGLADSDCAAFPTNSETQSPDVETAQSCSLSQDGDGDTLTGLADSDCAAFPVNSETQSPAVETPQTCSLSQDGDGDTLTGLADSDCSAFNTTGSSTIASAVETAQSCSLSQDGDGDTLTGLADSDCSAFNTATTTTEVAAVSGGGTGGFIGSSFGGGSSGSGFGGGITSGTPISNITSGTPISSIASSTCAEMFKTYMKKGKKNNIAEVKKLQSFLNKELGLKIGITGFFGNLTHDAVKAFQNKYKDTILTPWSDKAMATGYFFKTTQRQANLILCSSADIPMPELK